MSGVPMVELRSRDRMPGIGLGTFGSDTYSVEQVADAVLQATEVGYRHIDCASVYGNEAEVGRALATAQSNGIDRGVSG